MKNLVKAIILLFILIIGKNTKAQVCEFDTLGNYKTRTDCVIILDDNSFIISGRYGLGGQDKGALNKFKQFAFVRKMDSCNNKLWEIIVDSIESNGDYYQINTKLTKNEIFFNLSIYSSQSIKVFRFDETGKIFPLRTLDTLEYSLKINENSFLVFNTANDTIVLNYIDSNRISNNVYYLKILGFQAKFIDFKKTEINKIVILTMNKNNDSIYKVLSIDTVGTILDEITFKGNYGKILQMIFNKTNLEFYTFEASQGINSNYKKISLLKYNLNGELSKQISLYPEITSFSYSGNLRFVNVYSNKILFNFNKNLFIYDTAFNKIYKDSLGKFYQDGGISLNAYNAFVLDEEYVFQFGYLWQFSGLQSYPNYQGWIKKSSIFKYVKTISIIGIGTINTKGGYTQLIANITPTDATNKLVIWSISDTNIATITQTGLVTAKANGTVIVTATAADGGGAKATKTITISNQTVGINEVNLSNQITVYPNPASNTLTILTNNNLTIQQLQLLDITGKVIAQFNNQTEIDLSEIANGMYLLKIQTQNGNLVKQVVVNR